MSPADRIAKLEKMQFELEEIRKFDNTEPTESLSAALLSLKTAENAVLDALIELRKDSAQGTVTR